MISLKEWVAAHESDLLDEWMEKNEPLTPDSVSYGSDTICWWKGPCGHEWQAPVKRRTRGVGCPYCSGNKVLIGFNDLKSQHPELAREWSRKNTNLKPTEVTSMSNYKVLWKCSTCKYEWTAKIADRVRGSTCPVCAGKIVVAGINDLRATNPEIAAEWSDRNQTVDIRTVSSGSEKSVWWKCRTCGHEWRAAIYYRKRGHGCPACNKAARKEKLLEKKAYEQKIRNFRKDLIDLLLEYYAKRDEIRILYDDKSAIGLPLKYYFPDQKGALEISGRTSRENRRREMVKNDLCNKSDIWMIRLLFNDEPAYDDCICIDMETDAIEEQFEAIRTVFDMLKISAELNRERNLQEIFKDY